MLSYRNFIITEAFIIILKFSKLIKLNILKVFSAIFCSSKSENEIMEIELANRKPSSARGLVLRGSSLWPSSLRIQAIKCFFNSLKELRNQNQECQDAEAEESRKPLWGVFARISSIL